MTELYLKDPNRQLDDFFKAVDDYDKYLIGANEAELATNLNRVKTQTAQK